MPLVQQQTHGSTNTLHYKRSSRNINLTTTAAAIHGQKPIDMSFELRVVKACFEIILPKMQTRRQKGQKQGLSLRESAGLASF